MQNPNKYQFLIGNVYQITEKIAEFWQADMCQFLIGNVYRGENMEFVL